MLPDYNLAGERKPWARPPSHWLCGEEWFEDSVSDGLGDARPALLDPHFHLDGNSERKQKDDHSARQNGISNLRRQNYADAIKLACGMPPSKSPSGFLGGVAKPRGRDAVDLPEPPGEVHVAGKAALVGYLLDTKRAVP